MKLLPRILVIGISVLALTIVHLHNTSAAATALSNLVASMQPGTFATLTTANINPTLSNTGGASGIIFGYTEYIKWDPVGHRLYYLGGDHATSGTPVMRHVRYDETTNTWSILPEQSWFTAFSSHGYDHAAIDPARRYFYFRPPGNLALYRWNIDTGVWTKMPDNDVIQYNSCCVGIDYFPELHGVTWISDESGDNGGVTRLSDANGQWDRISQPAAYPMGDYHNFAEYNPVRKVVVFGGGENGAATRRMWKLDATGAVTPLNDAPVAIGIQNAIFTVDPVSGDYLVFTNTNQFYVYDVVTDRWTLKSSGSSVPIWTTSYSNPVHGVVGGPIDSYGVNVFVTCDGNNNCKVTLYKHSSSTTPPPPASDTTPPTVSITAPANNASVSGSITVSANATDNVGVAGVQFKLDGGNLAAEVTTSPYSISWNTTSASSGSHTLTAVARDGAGNQSTSTAVVVTVPAAGPPASSSSFAQKCAQPGVINCFSFDSTSSLFYTWPTGTVCDSAFVGQSNYGFGNDRRTPGNTAAIVQNGQCVYPQIDTTNPHSGTGSLKFTIPSNSSANSSGFFTEPFKRNPDGTFPYVGPGSPLGNVFYFQFYQKLDSNFVNADYQCLGGGCGGWKQAIFYGNPPNGSSSGSLESTMNNGWQRGVPQMYGQQGTDDYGVEDAIGCTYQKAASQGGAGSGFQSRPNYYAPLNPTCLHYVADQWMEFTGRIEIRGANDAPTSRVQLWVNGQLAVDYGAARVDWASDGGQGFGQFMLTPYHTNKDPGRAHPTGYTWYDDLIISTQPIAMSSGASGGGNPPSVSITAPASGSTVSGSSAAVSASASGSAGIAGVQFQLDGANLGSEDTTSPYSVNWNTTTAANGTHILTAVARDTAGNQATSTGVPVNVNNVDTTPPTVSITSPLNGSTVSGTITISATASDNVGVAGVQFLLDGASLGAEDTTPPYTMQWNTAAVSSGSHTITAVARDAAGNTVGVTVTLNTGAATAQPTTTYSIPDSGAGIWTAGGTATSLRIGSARIQPNAGTTTPSGMAIIGFSKEDVLVSEASVPTSAPIRSGRIYVDVDGLVNTGIALANPNNQDAVISFFFSDAAGMDFGQGSFILNAHHQTASFLTESPFKPGNRSSLSGTFTFSSSVPISVIASRGFTNERSEFLMTTLPVVALPTASTGPSTLPHFADGGGWDTQIILMNPTDSPLSGMVQFFGQGSTNQSAPLLTMVVNGASGSTFNYQIPGRGAARFMTQGATSSLTQVGSVRITPEGGGVTPSGLAIFSFKRSGVTVTQASVPALASGSAFRIYVELSGGSGQIGAVQSGLAIANPSQASTVVNLELTKIDGGPTSQRASLTVPAGSQIAQFINELFPDVSTPFQGIVRVTATSPVAATGLRCRYNKRGDFLITTTLPTNEAVTPSNLDVLFPQVVSGGGYVTQFILLGSSPGVNSGTVWVTSQNGTLLPAESLSE